MDKIILSGIKVYGHHGHTDSEREVGQVLVVDIELLTDLSQPGLSDILNHTIDYGKIYREVSQVVADGKHKLLEHIATDIAERLLTVSQPEEVLVRVYKPNPPVGGVCNYAAVEIVRNRSDFNLPDPDKKTPGSGSFK